MASVFCRDNKSVNDKKKSESSNKTENIFVR